MPIRIECPSCRAPLSVADNVSGKTVRCPKCAGTFNAQTAATARTADAAVQWEPSRRGAGAKIPAGPGGAPGWLMPVLLSGSVALLIFGGALVGLAVYYFHSDSPKANPSGPVPVAQGTPDKAPEPAPQPDTGKPTDPPPRPLPAGNGEEQFVDLPERNEGLNQIAGLTPPGGADEPAMGGEKPAGTFPVTLSNGSATRIRGKPGMAFRVDYQVNPGQMPSGATRYAWVIVTNGGRFTQTLPPTALRGVKGTLSGQAPGTAFLGGPYRSYLAVQRLVPGKLGFQEERISDILVFR